MKPVKSCSTAMSTQSIMFDRGEWTREAARRWLKRHGYKYGKVDASRNYLRYRQENPQTYCRSGMFRVKEIGKGIKLTLCCRKDK